jgi:uncharacterized protein (TIGR01777 family)
MHIVLAGGTGFLGSALMRRLASDGHTVTVLTRRPRHAHEVRWDPGGPPSALVPVIEHADAIVNLAGAPISKRWTAAHKREMWDSRILSTRTIVQAMKTLAGPPSLLNGSAIGIYGARGDETITEESPPGSTFLASLGREWEKEALAAAAVARVVLLRTGIALDRAGGALPLLALPFRLFVGGPLGSGRQYLSWIHRDDWVAMVHWALTATAVSGPLNVTAPNPVTNAEFSRTIGRVLRRPSLLPVPAMALRVAVGEMASELVTGQRVLPEKARTAGFRFEYPELEGALRAIYRA